MWQQLQVWLLSGILSENSCGIRFSISGSAGHGLKAPFATAQKPHVRHYDLIAGTKRRVLVEIGLALSLQRLVGMNRWVLGYPDEEVR